MSQTIIFSIGVGILLLAVFLAIWLADENRPKWTFQSKQKVVVEMHGAEGLPLSTSARKAALEEALEKHQNS